MCGSTTYIRIHWKICSLFAVLLGFASFWAISKGTSDWEFRHSPNVVSALAVQQIPSDGAYQPGSNGRIVRSPLPARTLQDIANGRYINAEYGILDIARFVSENILTVEEALEVNKFIMEGLNNLGISQGQSAKIIEESNEGGQLYTKIRLISNTDFLAAFKSDLRLLLERFCNPTDAKNLTSSIMGSGAFARFDGVHTAEILEQNGRLVLKLAGSEADKVRTAVTATEITTTVPFVPFDEKGKTTIGNTNMWTFAQTDNPGLFAARWHFLIPQEK